MPWQLIHADGLGPVCLLCRKFTGPQFLFNGADPICLDCAREIAGAIPGEESEEAQTLAPRRRKRNE